MSSHLTLTENKHAGKDPTFDGASGSAHEMEGRNSVSLVKGDDDSLAVDGVMDLPSEIATSDVSTTINPPKPSDFSDGDSNLEASISAPLAQTQLTTSVNSPSQRQSFRHKRTEATTEKESSPTTNEDVVVGEHSSTITLTGNNGRYPPPLFCPLTRRLFEDPVVAPDGHTYEREVLLQRDHQLQEYLTEERLYPNRALQEILDEEPRHPLLEQLWEHSLWPPDRPLPDAYYCPITFELMHVPVIDPEGNTYEKAAIVHWLRVNGHSPISRSPLTATQLYPNHVIRELLEYHANDKPHHAALSKWKAEPPPSVPDSSDIPIVYPSTYEELEAHHARMRHQRRKVMACTILGVICLIMAITGAALYGGYCIFISIWLGCCVRDSCRRLRELGYEHHQERLSLEEAQQRVEALQQRLRQLQQQEEQVLQRLTIESDGPQFQGGLLGDVPLDQQAMVQRVEALHQQFQIQQQQQQEQEHDPALPMAVTEEPSLQRRLEDVTSDQPETQERIENIHEGQFQEQPETATLPIRDSEEQVGLRHEHEENGDLEEGNHWPTTTLQDPSLTSTESTNGNSDPIAVRTVNVSEPVMQDSSPTHDDEEDIELGPIEISVGSPTTDTASKD